VPESDSQLVVRERQTAVLYDYARAIDTKDWALFRSVFTDDCEMTAPAGTTVGADTLTDHMRELHEELDGSLHRISNVQIISANGQTTARSYLDALLVRSGVANGETFRVTGTYADEFREVDSNWRIHRRTFTPLWREGNPAVLRRPIG
jgi:3-phenylpropionate/cinnamic acid dioxygenase small subunit